jgi:hypothetical protein
MTSGHASSRILRTGLRRPARILTIPTQEQKTTITEQGETRVPLTARAETSLVQLRNLEDIDEIN